MFWASVVLTRTKGPWGWWSESSHPGRVIVARYGKCVCVCVCAGWGGWSHVKALHGSPYFRLLLVSVVWKTLEADMRFSMYWPRTWFSDFSFRFSSLTASTLADRSKHTNSRQQHYKRHTGGKAGIFIWSCALTRQQKSNTQNTTINNYQPRRVFSPVWRNT